ncbi:hypothetical protein FIBSPDRAFT_953243 [Athelia psychrophila]|uniref:Uncharacterized protein n=1 Tax=Athelia psychrophila TaxID=1759441 RepID=A0A166KHD5_9AGAM|nr:hypothetical protein FIBSPDRAFT_953243 [Fibularhizoctonia sp. CBS 109695]
MPPPNHADSWLASVMLQGDLLMCEHGAIECKMEIIHEKAPETEATQIFEDPPTLTLWVTAHTSQVAKADGLVYQSPRTVVDQYIGYPDERRAPEWTRRANKIFEFQQPRATFVHIFLRLALNQWNLPAQGRLFQMHLWVQSSTV